MGSNNALPALVSWNKISYEYTFPHFFYLLFERTLFDVSFNEIHSYPHKRKVHLERQVHL